MYYDWYVVMMAAAVYAVLMGATFNAFGLFVVPVSSDLNLSRADMNTGLILLNMGGAVLAPLGASLGSIIIAPAIGWSIEHEA